MARNLTNLARKSLLMSGRRVVCSQLAIRSFADSLFEPDFGSGPEIPNCEPINIRLRGYDYVVLEKFMGYVGSRAKLVGANVVRSWATPATSSKVQIFKPRSSVVQSESNLFEYERTVQIDQLPSVRLGLLIEVLNNSLPEGVSMRLKQADPADEEIRFIPDLELRSLETQLRELEEEKYKRKDDV